MSFAGTSKHTRSFVVPDVFQEDSSCFAFGTLLDSWKKCAIPTNNLKQRSTRGSWSHPIKLRISSDDHNILREFNGYSSGFFPPNDMDTISSNVPTTSIESTPPTVIPPANDRQVFRATRVRCVRHERFHAPCFAMQVP